MAPKLRFISATVLVMAAFLAITTGAAGPKHAAGSIAPVPAKAANYRPDLWRLY